MHFTTAAFWFVLSWIGNVSANRGVSRGMQYGIDDALAKGRPVEYRRIES